MLGFISKIILLCGIKIGIILDVRVGEIWI